MRVEQLASRWFIVRGQHPRETYFGLLVDDVDASWTNRRYRAAFWGRKELADDVLQDLRRRLKLKKQRRLL